jgi:hypothetical protein
MREYQRKRRAKLKSLQENVKKSVKIVKKDLHPPPKVEITDQGALFENVNLGENKSLRESDSKTFEGIDYEGISRTSEYRRFIYRVKTGHTFRGTNAQLDIELKKFTKIEEDIKIIKELSREQKNYGDVMKEFKDKLKELKKRKQDDKN